MIERGGDTGAKLQTNVVALGDGAGDLCIRAFRPAKAACRGATFEVDQGDARALPGITIFDCHRSFGAIGGDKHEVVYEETKVVGGGFGIARRTECGVGTVALEGVVANLRLEVDLDLLGGR